MCACVRACVLHRHACAGVCQRRMSDIFLVCLEMGSVTELKSLSFCIDCLAQRIPGIHLHLCPPPQCWGYRYVWSCLAFLHVCCGF